MTKLAIAINIERCVGCHTCANACKMQNNVPMSMLWIRILTDGADTARRRAWATYPDLSAHLPSRGSASTARTRRA